MTVQKIPRYRSFGIKTITKLTEAASYGGITDSQSGFRAYNRNALSKINLYEDGMAVSIEILLRAKEKNLLTAEVPITISYDVKDTSTHNALSHGVGLIYAVLQFISLRHPLAFYGLPGIALLGVAAFFLKVRIATVLRNRIRFYEYDIDICRNSCSWSGLISYCCYCIYISGPAQRQDKLLIQIS